MKIELHISKF